MLGAFAWAATDEKYEYWIKNKLTYFKVAAWINVLIFGIGIATGFTLYSYS